MTDYEILREQLKKVVQSFHYKLQELNRETREYTILLHPVQYRVWVEGKDKRSYFFVKKSLGDKDEIFQITVQIGKREVDEVSYADTVVILNKPYNDIGEVYFLNEK